MNPDRRQRLEALPGRSWDVLSNRWEEGFFLLKQFSGLVGNCLVPASHMTDDGFQLGTWVARQRARKHKTSPDRRQRLEALPGWSWAPFSDQWEEGFSHLKQFYDLKGNCRVPISHKTDDGFRLGGWVSVQRSRKNTINVDRRQRLEGLPAWSWNVRSDKWEEGFSHLKQFSERMGHCQVSRGYKTGDGFRLGGWVSTQKSRKDTINVDRRQRLEGLRGWSWSVRSDKWEEGFSHLKQFSDLKGNCRVSVSYKTDGGFPLGVWVSKQRTKRHLGHFDRRRRLEALPGWVWKR
jgi:Helicase associated domain